MLCELSDSYFAFTINLKCSAAIALRDSLENCFENFKKNYENLLNALWLTHWQKLGDNLVLQLWNIKYKDYLVNETATTAAEPEQQQSKVALEQAEEEQPQQQSWQELWQQHYQEVQQAQYQIFQSAFDTFYFDLRETLQQQANETDDEDEESVLSESTESIEAELAQIQLLGLPTTFGTNISSKTTKIAKKKQNNAYLLLTDSEESEELEDDEDEVTDLANMSDALHHIQQTGIAKKKKKRNRKLRKLPAFFRADQSLLKYWRKRFSLFSRFDEGIRLDKESWFSVTPEKIAKHIAQRFACDLIVDALCGCGGNTIQFAKTCGKVIAIDIDPAKIEMAKHNAAIYGVAHKIEFIVADFLQICHDNAILKADIVFLSPPWGGPKYKKNINYDIEKSLLPVGATELAQKARIISENIILFLPRNSKLQQILKLAGVGKNCEMEHHYLNSRLVAISAIYGKDIIKQKSPIL